jgi:hypothetical protein
MTKIEKEACLRLIGYLKEIDESEFSDLISNIEWCMGSYNFDKNPTGLIKYTKDAIYSLSIYLSSRKIKASESYKRFVHDNDKYNYIKDKSYQDFIINYKLKKIKALLLNPTMYYREINKKYLAILKWQLKPFWSKQKSPVGLLVRKEFGFERFDEFTGKKLFTKSVINEIDKEKYKHEYRGITLYLKEILESFLALILMISFLVLFSIFAYCFIYNYIVNPSIRIESTEFLKFSTYILYIASGFLILDSLLLISALISSPGIDETIDSISVTIAGILLYLIGANADGLFKAQLFVLRVIVPLALIVVILIFTKHILRRMNGSDYFRKIEGMDSVSPKKKRIG